MDKHEGRKKGKKREEKGPVLIPPRDLPKKAGLTLPNSATLIPKVPEVNSLWLSELSAKRGEAARRQAI